MLQHMDGPIPQENTDFKNHFHLNYNPKGNILVTPNSTI